MGKPDNRWRRIAIQLLLVPSYILMILFVLDRLGALKALPWLGHVFEGLFYAAGVVVLSLSLGAILRMNRPLGGRIAYMILAIVLFVPYMLIPIGLYLALSLFFGVKF